MSDEQAGGGAAAEQGGVFGKLPASRPGTRSPRRATAAGAKARPAPKAKPAPRATSKPKPKAEPRPRRPQSADQPPPEAPETPAADKGGGLDDLAWAGVAAVAEAATLGVRLANRAFGALRDGVDRR